MASAPSDGSVASAAPSTHWNIICDECGVSPLIGIRYKAKHLYDYDLCESCMHSGMKDMYVAIDKPIPILQAMKIGPPKDNFLRAYSIQEAAFLIKENSSDHSVAWIDMEDDEEDAEECERLRSALASNAHLRIIHVHACNQWPYGRVALEAIADGIMSSSSIQRVMWCIPMADRKHPWCGLALQKMISHNSTVQALFVKIQCRFDDEVLKMRATSSEEENKLAQDVFDALKVNTSITDFRFESYHALPEKIKQNLLDIVQAKDCSMHRVNVTGLNGDGRMELVLSSKRAKWKERFGDKSSSGMDQLDVLLEARDNSSVEPVAAAYHLLRSCPDFVTNDDA